MQAGKCEALYVVRDVSAVADSQTASRSAAVRGP